MHHFPFLETQEKHLNDEICKNLRFFTQVCCSASQFAKYAKALKYLTGAYISKCERVFLNYLWPHESIKIWANRLLRTHSDGECLSIDYRFKCIEGGQKNLFLASGPAKFQFLQEECITSLDTGSLWADVLPCQPSPYFDAKPSCCQPHNWYSDSNRCTRPAVHHVDLLRWCNSVFESGILFELKSK